MSGVALRSREMMSSWPQPQLSRPCFKHLAAETWVFLLWDELTVLETAAVSSGEEVCGYVDQMNARLSVITSVRYHSLAQFSQHQVAIR